MELYFDINLVAVAVAAISAQILGILWYSKLLFGNIIKKITGEEKVKLNPKSYLGSFIPNFIMAYTLSYFIQLSGATNSYGAAMLACVLWLGFILTTKINGAFFEKRNLITNFIGIFYYLGSMVAMALILSAWHFPR